MDLVFGLCEAAEKLGVSPQFPRPADLSEAAFEQLGALVDLCRRQELSVSIDPMETEMAFTVHEGTELPTREKPLKGRFLVTDSKPAELFGVASERFYVVRHLGPFTVVDDKDLEGKKPGSRVRLKLKSVPDARVVYRLLTRDQVRQLTQLPPEGAPGG